MISGSAGRTLHNAQELPAEPAMTFSHPGGRKFNGGRAIQLWCPVFFELEVEGSKLITLNVLVPVSIRTGW